MLGTLACSPFHVRFGKFQLLRPSDKKVFPEKNNSGTTAADHAKVEFRVNDVKQDYPMKLGEGGEAFFVFETTDDIPAALQTSPLSSPVASPKAEPIESAPADNLPDPEPLDLAMDVPQPRPKALLLASSIERPKSVIGRSSICLVMPSLLTLLRRATGPRKAQCGCTGPPCVRRLVFLQDLFVCLRARRCASNSTDR